MYFFPVSKFLIDFCSNIRNRYRDFFFFFTFETQFLKRYFAPRRVRFSFRVLVLPWMAGERSTPRACFHWDRFTGNWNVREPVKEGGFVRRRSARGDPAPHLGRGTGPARRPGPPRARSLSRGVARAGAPTRPSRCTPCARGRSCAVGPPGYPRFDPRALRCWRVGRLRA